MPKASRVRRVLSVGASLLVIFGFCLEVRAGGFGVREQSAVGLGMAFAGEGTAGMGLSAMFWNPAAVAQANGLWSESLITGIFPHTVITAGPGTAGGPATLPDSSGNIGMVGVVPAFYSAYRLNPNWYAGLSVNAPFGLATKSNFPWAGQQLAITAKVQSIDLNPVVGWKPNDTISLAAGPRLLWFKGEFTRALAPLVTSPLAAIELDDIGFGFSAGLTLTPTPATEYSLGYRSRVKLNLKGDLDVTGAGAVPASATAMLPDQVAFGTRQRMNDRLTLLGTVEWTHWSLLQNVRVNNVLAPATVLTFNYRDGWFFALGGEYQWSLQTTLRAGIGYEISPVRDAARDTSLPDCHRWWFSAGLTQNWTKRLTFDLGYAFVEVTHAPINVIPGHPDFANLGGGSLVGTSSSHVHVVSAGLRYKWGVDPLPRKTVTK